MGGARTDLELVHELLRGGREHDDAAGAGVDEALLHGLVDEGQQRVVVAVHVQQPDLRAREEGMQRGRVRSSKCRCSAATRGWLCVCYRLVVDAQLRPRDDLQQLLQRAIPSCTQRESRDGGLSSIS